MSTTARLYVNAMPEMGQGAKKIEIDCKFSTSTAYLIPGGLELTDEQVITSLLYKHESECGRCRTERLWQHADLNLRTAVEETWQQMAAAEIRERRN